MIGADVALAIGFFNAIMFPVIFTMTLERSSAPAAATSGLLCVAIVGGAALPVISGRVADLAASLAPAFFLTTIGYLGVALFAVAATRARPRSAGVDAVAAGAMH